MGGSKSKPVRVLFLGLDSAGKTSILRQAVDGSPSTPEPTKGFTVENVNFKKMQMSVVDVEGKETTRQLWRHQYVDLEAVVWVIDATDVDRAPESASELHKAMKEINKKVPLLVFSNKIDLDGAMSTEELTTRLQLKNLDGRVNRVVPCSAANGEGVEEGLKWLATESRQAFSG